MICVLGLKVISFLMIWHEHFNNVFYWSSSALGDDDYECNNNGGFAQNGNWVGFLIGWDTSKYE